MTDRERMAWAYFAMGSARALIAELLRHVPAGSVKDIRAEVASLDFMIKCSLGALDDAADPSDASEPAEDPNSAISARGDADLTCPRPTCAHKLREHGPKGCTLCACEGFLLQV